MLKFNVKNKEEDKSNMFKQIIYYFYQPEQKKVIQLKFDLFIENKTWKTIFMLQNP